MSLFLDADLQNKLDQKLETYSINSKSTGLTLNLHHYKCEGLNRDYYDYEDANNLPPILLCVHGFGSSSAWFGKFFYKIQEKYKIDCCVYDQKGQGQFLENLGERKVMRFKVDELVGCLVEVLESLIPVRKSGSSSSILSARRRIYLLGDSLGGLILLKAASERLLDKFILVNVDSGKGLSGIILENPYIRSSPTFVKPILVSLAIWFCRAFPNRVSNAPRRPELTSSNLITQEILRNDPNFARPDMRTMGDLFSCSKSFYDKIKKADKNANKNGGHSLDDDFYWPKDLPYSLNLSKKDQISDYSASEIFTKLTANLNANTCVNYYDGLHCIKLEVDEILNEYVDAVAAFISAERF